MSDSASSAAAAAAELGELGAATEFTSNIIDLTAGNATSASAGGGDSGAPSFFILHSSTSLFAGVPHMHGKLDGEALAATFNSPQDIVVDRNQQLFIADANNASIRRINKLGKVSTIASIGGGDGQIENQPNGLAFDSSGAMYILQSGRDHHIYQVSPIGQVRQIAGANNPGHNDVIKGDLFKASFNYPRATGVDSKNRLYIVEKLNNAVRRVDLVDKSVTTLLDQFGKPLDLLNPEGIVVDQFDDIYVADTGHHRILKISPREEDGMDINHVQNYCGKYGEAGYANGESADGRLYRPTGLAIDKQNHLWICDSGNNCVRMFSYRSELLFTISGKGSAAQEKLYHNPTSIALTYDLMYGAEMAPTTPDEVANDPTHPLYYSYMTPVVFVADSQSHTIRKIHTILMEPANALIDVFNNDPSELFPMHSALAYGEIHRRDDLMRVLLMMKPKLLQQQDNEERIPLHIACMESATPTAESISLEETIKPMIRLAKIDSIAAVDKDGKTPIYYAMKEMALHAFNEAALCIVADKDNPSKASAYSRALISYLISLSPSCVTHPSVLNYTLHWMIFQGFPLKVLKKYVEGYEQQRSKEPNSTLPNPFQQRDQAGRLPLHIACMLHAGGGVGLDIISWLVESSDGGSTLRTRDLSVLEAVRQADPTATPESVPVPGHFPLFYACTEQVETSNTAAAAASSSSGPPASTAYAPLYKLSPSQKSIVEYLASSWPESILECEGAPILHGQDTPSSMHLVDTRTVSSVKASITNTFVEWVFYLKALELLEIFLRKLPSTIDNLAWQDSQEHDEPTLPGQGPNMMSMLHCSACIGDFELVELLLKANANPFNQDTRMKLPIDYCRDPRCLALLKQYMAFDPRRPKTPEPVSEYEVVETRTVETQTATGDSILESAREKLKHREAELQSEATRLAAHSLALQKELELERIRMRDREEALQRQADADREEERQRAEAEVLQKTLELNATKQRLTEELELERSRLKARELEAIRQAEHQLAAAQAKMRQELLEAAEVKLKEEQAKLHTEMSDERERLRQKQLDLGAQYEHERLSAKTALESALTEAAEIRLAAEQRRLQEEVEVERLKLRQRELELARAAEHEKDMTRMKLEHEFASKAQALTTNSTKLSEQLELERASLRQREADLKREFEHERQMTRLQLEHDLRTASEAALAAEQRKLADHLEQEMTRIRQREEQMQRDLIEATAASKRALESELASRSDEGSRLMHARLSAEFEAAKAALLMREKERQAYLEEAARLARESAASEASRSFQSQLEAERDKLAAAFAQRAKLQEQAVEEELRQARIALEDQKHRQDEIHRLERLRLQNDFENRRSRMDEEERTRLATIELEDQMRREQFERERAKRIALDAQERDDLSKQTALDRDELARRDLTRQENFDRLESERKARWDAEEANRLAARQAERERFESDRLALLAEVESTKKRLEEESLARTRKDSDNLDDLRRKFELEKDEHRRRLEAAFEAEKARLQLLAHEDQRELLRKIEREKQREDEMRAEERRKDEARLAAERDRIRMDADAKRAADEARIEFERARLDAERDELQKAQTLIESQRAEAAMRAAEEAARDRSRRQREDEDAAAASRAAAERDAAHRHALAQREAAFKVKLAERESALRAAEEQRLVEKSARIQSLEEDVERTRRELEIQIAEKHATRRGLQEKSIKVDHLEKQLEQMSKLKAVVPPIRYTSNPLDVDPSNLGDDELPSVANSIASFAKNFQTMTFKSLLALLLSIPHSQISKATILLRLYLSTHLGCAKRVDESSGLLPLHMAAQSGLYRELVDIILKEYPLALKTEDRNGVYPIFYACAFRRAREAARRHAYEVKCGGGGDPELAAELTHEDFRPDTVRRYNLELIKYFMIKFPDSIYLPNTLRPTPNGIPVDQFPMSILSQPDDEWIRHSLSVVEFAIEEQDVDLLTLLFELTGGDFLNAIDSVGRNYLHRAAGAGRLTLCQWMIEIGQVNPWLLCNADRTPLEYVDSNKHEDVALYLTREMAKVAPELRVKHRRGGRHMLIREWSDEDGIPLASRFIGGRDSFLPTPVRAHPMLGSDTELDQLLDSALNSAANTPRGQLKPITRVKSAQREEPDTASHTIEVKRPATAKRRAKGVPVAGSIGSPMSGHTTHIHVYSPVGTSHPSHSASMPNLLRSPAGASLKPIITPTKMGMPFSASGNSPLSASHLTMTQPFPSPSRATHDAHDSDVAYDGYGSPSLAASRSSPHRSLSKSSNGYHWEFLERPRSSTLMMHAAAPRLATTRDRQAQSHSHSHSGHHTGTAASVENTIYALQATTSNLHQLLTDLQPMQHTNKRAGYRR